MIGLLLIVLIQAPVIDLTGCKDVDILSSDDRQIVVIIWRCPRDTGWIARYRLEGVRATILAKPAPSPTP